MDNFFAKTGVILSTTLITFTLFIAGYMANTYSNRLGLAYISMNGQDKFSIMWLITNNPAIGHFIVILPPICLIFSILMFLKKTEN